MYVVCCMDESVCEYRKLPIIPLVFRTTEMTLPTMHHTSPTLQRCLASNISPPLVRWCFSSFSGLLNLLATFNNIHQLHGLDQVPRDARRETRDQILDSRYWIVDTEQQILNIRYWILDTGYQILDTGQQVLDTKYQTLDTRYSVLLIIQLKICKMIIGNGGCTEVELRRSSQFSIRQSCLEWSCVVCVLLHVLGVVLLAWTPESA